MKNLFRNIALAALSLLVLVSCKKQESENLDPASIFKFKMGNAGRNQNSFGRS